MMLLPLAGLLCGCPVTQSQDTPVDALQLRASATREPAQVYVPSYHSLDRQWPLVITLHGTHGWDGYRRQMMEWKDLAERKGLVVVSPYLKSPQGILPVIRSLWRKDLAHDEQTILSLIDQLAERYNVDRKAVMLTGFSAGGYPMYYTGLRNPDRFRSVSAFSSSPGPPTSTWRCSKRSPRLRRPRRCPSISSSAATTSSLCVTKRGRPTAGCASAITTRRETPSREAICAARRSPGSFGVRTCPSDISRTTDP